MNEQTITIEAAGLKLSGLAWGDETATPVLALHGWMDNAGSFAPLAPCLPGARLVAVDLPGHGQSPLGTAADWFSFADNLWVIHEIIASLGWQQVDLVGHSMGGGLCALYAAGFPEQVRSLVSIDMLGPVSSPPDEVVKQIRRGVVVRSRGASRPRRFETRQQALAARVGGDFDLQCAEILARRGLGQDSQGYFWRGDRQLKFPSMNRYTEEQVLHALSSLSCPTLLLRAETLRYPDFAQVVEKRIERLRNARVVTVPGGHHLHMEHPEHTAREIQEFWGSAASG